MLPAPAQIIGPGYKKCEGESENAVPPDDRVAEKIAVPEQVDDDDAHHQRGRGHNSRHRTVVGPLKYAEKRDVERKDDIDDRDCPQVGMAVDRRLAASARSPPHTDSVVK